MTVELLSADHSAKIKQRSCFFYVNISLKVNPCKAALALVYMFVS